MNETILLIEVETIGMERDEHNSANTFSYPEYRIGSDYIRMATVKID